MNALTNIHNLPESICNAIAQDPYDGPQGDLSTISVTTLIAPPKIRMLKERHKDEIQEDVSDQIWKLLGSSVHAMIERAETKDSLVEERLEMKVGEKTVSGKTDIYHNGVIQDYKVTSVWSVVYAPEGKKEWETQLNCLAALYRNAGFEVNKLQVVAILRDHQASKAKTDASYPQTAIVVIDIPLWEIDQQEAYIESRVHIHGLCEKMEDDNIPACSPEDRWQSETKYAVMKNANKRADKVFASNHEALDYMNSQDKKLAWRVDIRLGSDKRCLEYCSVKDFCHHGRTLGQPATVEMDV